MKKTSLQPGDDAREMLRGGLYLRRFLVRQTLVSIAISATLSGVFTLVVFGWPVAVSSADGTLAADFLPQTIISTFLSALIPSCFAWAEYRNGTLRCMPFALSRQLPSGILLQCAIFAAVSGLVFGGGAWWLVSKADTFSVRLPILIALKMTYGGVLALLWTPLGVVFALSCRTSGERPLWAFLGFTRKRDHNYD